MLKRPGAVISVLAVAACAACAVILAWYLLFVRLPDPRTANREGLFRWLVLRDLSAETPNVQRILVDRLQSELRTQPQEGAGNVSLTPHHQDRLQKNIEHLKHVWFRERVQEYNDVDPARRMAFLEQQIDAIGHWTTLKLPGESSVNSTGDYLAVQFFAQIDGWIEKATGQERQQMIKAVQHGVVCWLATRDLAEQSPRVRLELAQRIARELNAGMKLDEIQLELTPTQRERQLANGEFLLEAWLRQEARAFAALEESKRAPYVEERIDEVVKWEILTVLASSANGTDGNSQAAGLARLTTLVEQWIQRAPPDERASLEQLVAHVQRQLLWRQIRPKP